MSTAEKAAAWAERIAADDTHGYDQGSRWGPDYDCSALVIQAYENAGVPVKSRGATYTGNMRGVFLACGFADVTGQTALSTGAGLRRGDVLLHERNHTALYAGAGRIIHARGNELGGVTGGRSGDQTGREICVQAYFNYPWDCVLRYAENGAGSAGSFADAQDDKSGTYTVRSGDSLWSIAERELGDPFRYEELRQYNGLGGYEIYPGQTLKLPGSAAEPEAASAEESDITAMARDVIAGKYGNGLARVLKLGTKYKAVQAEVNRLLAGN